MSPTFFLNAVVSLIRVGRAARGHYQENVLSKQKIYFFNGTPISDELTSKSIEDWAFSMLELDETHELHRKLLKRKGSHTLVRNYCAYPKTHPIWSEAVEQICREHGLFSPSQIEVGDRRVRAAPPIQILTHRDWLKQTGEKPSSWARFGLSLVEISLDFMAAEPAIFGEDGLGLSPKARTLVSSLVPNLAQVLRADFSGAGQHKSVAELVGESLFQSALVTLIEHPDLVLRREQWRPIVSAAAAAVHEQAGKTISSGETLFAQDRVSSFVKGPFVHAIAKAVDDNSDKLLTGSFEEEKVLGEVARNVLRHVAKLTPEDAELYDFFSPQGATLIFEKSLEVIAARPELLVKGTGEKDALVRLFLTSVPSIVTGAPRPFNNKAIATDLAVLALEIARDYSVSQVLSDPDNKNWDAVLADISIDLIGTIFDGFSDAIKQAGDDRTQSIENLFSNLFSRSQAVSIVRTIAHHVAGTPGLLVGDKASSEIRNIASGVASFIAADNNNKLLTGDQWQEIVVLALDLAVKNPGALFDIDESEISGQFAVALIRDLVRVANGEIEKNNGRVRGRGLILVGQTLKETIEITLMAASSRALGALDVENDSNVAADVRSLVERLLALSRGDGGLHLSAAEWVRSYRHLVTEVVHNGIGAVLDDPDSEAISLEHVEQIIYEVVPA